jgi:carbamoyl-phosphate synthase small subunit
MESTKCHLGAIIVRDLSCVVSNYRSRTSLDEYCKKENVIGLANLDTRALTKVLRETGCLVGVVTTDSSKTDAELATMAKSWTIVGKDLLSVVSCTEPYEWNKGTIEEWEFNPHIKKLKQSGPFHVRQPLHQTQLLCRTARRSKCAPTDAHAER